MKLLDDFRQTQKVKKAALEKLDEAILAARDDDRVNPDEVIKLMDARRKIVLNGSEHGIERGDILKVVANVAIVAVMVGFEMSHIMNQKGAKFIKPL